MPKPLWEWLHYQALQYQIVGEAYLTVHTNQWHRGDPTGWSTCGRAWLGGRVRHSAGYGHERRSPWAGSGSLRVRTLCVRCFAEELVWLKPLAEALRAHGKGEGSWMQDKSTVDR